VLSARKSRDARIPEDRHQMISRYIAEALRRAQYRIVDDGLFCATVAGLPGVIATGKRLEACRDQLAEVIEEWLLVRVSQGMRIPRLGAATVQVKRAN
jgi:predicted RNase H-like HicB family nuclease